MSVIDLFNEFVALDNKIYRRYSDGTQKETNRSGSAT